MQSSDAPTPLTDAIALRKRKDETTAFCDDESLSQYNDLLKLCRGFEKSLYLHALFPKEAIEFTYSWMAMSDERFVDAIRGSHREHPEWFEWTAFATALRTELDLRRLLKYEHPRPQ